MSKAEREVALAFCHGLTDKEVANKLFRSYHTIRVHKKAIYQKQGISKDTELLWYMILERLGRPFDLQEIRNKGIEPPVMFGEYTAKAFRIISTKYIKLYDGVEDLLDSLRKAGKNAFIFYGNIVQ